MFLVTKAQRELLNRYIPDLDNLIQGDDIQALLDAINFLIIDDVEANDGFLSKEGVLIQRAWDDIFYQN